MLVLFLPVKSIVYIFICQISWPRRSQTCFVWSHCYMTYRYMLYNRTAKRFFLKINNYQKAISNTWQLLYEMMVVSIHLDRSNTDSIYYYIFFMCTDSTYRYHFFYVQVTFACGFYFSVIKLFCNVHAHALEHVP